MTTKIGPYQIDQIYTGDARELAPAIPSGSAALAFCDPPYWVGFRYNAGTDRQMDRVDPAWIAGELQRIGAVAMITPSIGYMWNYPPPAWTIAWYKPAAMGRNGTGGANNWEPILTYGSAKISVDVIRSQITPDNTCSFHACPKPIDLMRQIIERFTNPGDLVIDLMCGSGTTAAAAKMLGRHWIGFEIDPTMAKKARERVRNTQPPLLIPEPYQAQLIEAIR